MLDAKGKALKKMWAVLAGSSGNAAAIAGGPYNISLRSFHTPCISTLPYTSA
jgi:hypothetical protein